MRAQKKPQTLSANAACAASSLKIAAALHARGHGGQRLGSLAGFTRLQAATNRELLEV
jgi:hypothetical protein